MGENDMDDFRVTPAAIRALAEGNVENFVAAATPGGIGSVADVERDRLSGIKDVMVSLGIDPATGAWEAERRLTAGNKDELRRALNRMRSLVEQIERQEGLSA